MNPLRTTTQLVREQLGMTDEKNEKKNRNSLRKKILTKKLSRSAYVEAAFPIRVLTDTWTRIRIN